MYELTKEQRETYKNLIDTLLDRVDDEYLQVTYYFLQRITEKTGA